MEPLRTAREAARKTPASRNRAADFYRTAAIGFVVVGHWFLVAPFLPGGQITLRNILAEQPWTQYLTWLFQVMPVFFFVGGYSNAASWSSARNDPTRRNNWMAGRLRRLLMPVLPLVVLWSIAAVIAFWLETDPELVRDASRAALIPVWFLAVYIMVTMVVPITFLVWERISLWSVVALASLAIMVDLFGVGLGHTWLRWINYGCVWLAVHQLGYWWRSGRAHPAAACILLIIGAVWLALLMVPAGYPVSMVSVPGDAFSNTRPPTTAMLALGSVQIGLMLLLARPVAAWLERETPWAIVILIGQRIMTVYLWHLTVVIVAIGLSLLANGTGLQTEPGTPAWWAFRPIWICILIVMLLPLIAVFGRFEAGSRTGTARSANAVQASIGACLACVGLTMLALRGIGLDGMPGFDWPAVLLVVVGTGLSAMGRPVRS